MEQSPIPNSSPEDWRLLYQVSAQDVAFFKHQQWLVAYYGLLLFGALIGISKIMADGPSDAERLMLVILAVAALGSCLYMVWNLHQAISEARNRLEAARLRLSQSVAETIGKGTSPGRADVSILLTGVLVSAAFLTIWLLLCRLHAA